LVRNDGKLTDMPRDGTATRDRILDAAQQLVLDRGFAATSIDAVLTQAPATKGAFFHHFPSKDDLGRALVERYAAADVRMLDELLAATEAESDDPAAQLIALIGRFEEVAEELAPTSPGCLFVSFIYESRLASEDDDLIAATILHYRTRLLEKLEAAAHVHPPAIDVDLASLADQLFSTFEGGFILARALDEPGHLRAQLAHLRHYLELLFQLPSAGRTGRDESRPA
jgi:TetR/AcrR family transcriptional repressor of nem operon